MKKPISILFLSISLLFASCNKDDDQNEVAADESAIEGSWKFTSVETKNGQTITEFLGQEIAIDFESYGKDFATVVNFSVEPQTFSSEGGYTTVLTTNVNGESTVEESVDSFPTSGTWSVEGNILTFTIDGVSADYEITSLSDTEMKWKQEINESVEESGIPITLKATYNFTVEKQ